MKISIEIDTNTVMENVGKAIEAGAIGHWGTGTYHPAAEGRSAHVAIDEQLRDRGASRARAHVVKHRLGERALRQGLEERRCAGLPAIERGDAPHIVVDLLVQHALFGEVLYPAPEREDAR